MAQQGKRNKGGSRRGPPDHTKWKKGQSGNPKGRPPLPADTKLALRALVGPALEGLQGVVLDPMHPRHEQACEYLVDREEGRPRQTTEISGPGGGPIETADRTLGNMTSEQKRKRLNELMEKYGFVRDPGKKPKPD